MTFWISQGKVTTVYKWGGQMYKLFYIKFTQDLAHQKSLKPANFWESYLKNKKVDVFLGRSLETVVHAAGDSPLFSLNPVKEIIH